MSPSVPLLKYRRTIRLKNGGGIVLYLDLHEIEPEKGGLFLEKYKLSWIAFDIENPDRKILMDAHHPFGIHYHVDQGKQIQVDLQTLDEALKFFEKQVILHFGELEESFYEDLHI